MDRLLNVQTEIPPEAPTVSGPEQRIQILEAELAVTKSELAATKSELAATKTELAATKTENGELRQLTRIDGLTGTYNRRALDDEIIRKVSGAIRSGDPMSILYTDVNGLKPTNDSYGHQAGDDLLRKVAATLMGGTRDTDYTFRYGGDEFVVLLPATQQSQAIEVAARLLCAVSQQRITVGDNQTSVIVASIAMGISSFIPNRDTIMAPGSMHSIADKLIEQADQAMYRAKHTDNGFQEVALPFGIASPDGEIKMASVQPGINGHPPTITYHEPILVKS